MSYKFENDKFSTSNPFIDIVIYNAKILGFNCIIKDQQKADSNETVESLKNFGLYSACLENHVELGLFDNIPENFLKEVGMNEDEIEVYLEFKNVNYIPKKYHSKLIELLKPWYINNYEELNPYFRTLIGLPPIGDPGIPLRDYEYLIPDDFVYDAVYVHELGPGLCKTLDTIGVLDVIKSDYPNMDYLNYITLGLDIYEIRNKLDFQILWLPNTIDIPSTNESLTEEFEYRYSLNREYMLGTVYSSPMEIESEYYHNFMQIYLIMITMMDLLLEIQSHIVKKDVLDRRCIEYIFSMYGIPYYSVIPYKYQERMCKNVNSLIKYKSCTTEMINLTDLFGFDNINIVKYYLLKVRKQNAWGEFEYEENEKLVCEYNDILVHETLEEKMSEPSSPLPVPPNLDWYPDSSTNSIDTLNSDYVERYIKYPFDYFLQKGNVMFVKLDGYILKEDIDYKILNYNKIRFLNNIANGKTNLTYEFYYDKETIDKDFIVDTDHKVETVAKQFTYSKERGNKFDLNPIPWTNYFINDNNVIVMVSSVWLSPAQYAINKDTNILTIDTTTVDIKDRDVWVIMVYSKSLKTRFDKKSVTANRDNQVIFYIPEPFDNYTINGNNFFVTLGSTFIEKDRYQIHAVDQTGKSYIQFTDGTQIDSGRSVTFNFLYSTNSIVNKLEVKTKEIHIVADKNYQYEFDIDFPVDHYDECRYKTYVKLLDWWLPEEMYTTIGDKLVFIDQSISLQPNDEMDVLFVYVDKDRTKKENKNIKVATDFRVATKDKQSIFDIKFPVTQYFTKLNKLVVDVEGIPLEEGKDYDVSYDDKTVSLYNIDYKPMKGQRVNYTFFYNQDAEYVITMDYQNIMIETQDQDEFSLDFPFFPYLQTGQDFLVLIGSTLISKDRYEVKDQFTLKIKNISSTRPKNSRYITVIYIYNNYYTLNSNQALIVDWVPMQIISDQNYLEIPTPFEDYIENDWPYFVSYNNRQFLSDDKYEVYNDTFYTYPSSDLLNKKYGETITFTFIYLMRSPWVVKEKSEDYRKTHDLYFCKIPIDDLYSSQYMKDKSRWKEYNSMVAADGWWDGKDYKNGYHDQIIDEIYKQPWNYARTKYYNIIQTLDFSAYTSTLSYFYSMLYDDVLLEEKVTIEIPSIAETHNFKLAHVFIYMTCLNYVFNDLEDFILDQPSKIMYVQGFNFHSSLNDIKEYLRKYHREQGDFPIWDFIIPTEQIKDITEFFNIFKNDLNVRNTVCKLMVKSDTYREYMVWKHIYDSLMIWKFNLKYFTLKDGSIAKTYKQFLKEKEPILYNSIEEIESISDEETKQDTIISIVDDIVYILDDFIDGDLKYIFESLPGQSGEYAMRYLYMMIEFFKSYKIVLLTKGTQSIVIGAGGEDPDSTMRGYDLSYIHETFSKKEYYPLIEKVNANETDIYQDKDPWMKEYVEIKEFHRINEKEKYHDLTGYVELDGYKSFATSLSGTVNIIRKYSINVTQPDHGRIEINGQVGTYFEFNEGDSVKVEAIADSGYIVANLYVERSTNSITANILKGDN